jgi:hypothetical protein
MSTQEKKRDIYIVMSGATPLHAVCTERQARRFVEQYGHPKDDCRLFLGFLSYHKTKLIPPRRLKPKQIDVLKEALGG